MAGWNPIIAYSKIKRIGKKRWIAARGFTCLPAANVACEDFLYGKVFPGRSPPYGPKCWTVETLPDAAQGRDIVIAHYETRRIPGKGTVSVAPISQAMRKKFDRLGHVCYGDEQVNGALVRWEAVKGSPAAIESRGVYVLHTAFEPNDPMLTRLDQYVDMVNSNHMRKFYGAHAYTLLMQKPSLKSLGPGDLVYADISFLWYKWGWNNEFQVQSKVLSVVELPVLDADGEPIIDDDDNVRTAHDSVWLPRKTTGANIVRSPAGFHLPLLSINDKYGNPLVYTSPQKARPQGRMLYGTRNMVLFNNMVDQ